MNSRTFTGYPCDIFPTPIRKVVLESRLHGDAMLPLTKIAITSLSAKVDTNSRSSKSTAALMLSHALKLHKKELMGSKTKA